MLIERAQLCGSEEVLGTVDKPRDVDASVLATPGRRQPKIARAGRGRLRGSSNARACYSR